MKLFSYFVATLGALCPVISGVIVKKQFNPHPLSKSFCCIVEALLCRSFIPRSLLLNDALVQLPQKSVTSHLRYIADVCIPGSPGNHRENFLLFFFLLWCLHCIKIHKMYKLYAK